jgi:hypothetical protein
MEEDTTTKRTTIRRHFAVKSGISALLPLFIVLTEEKVGHDEVRAAYKVIITSRLSFKDVNVKEGHDQSARCFRELKVRKLPKASPLVKPLSRH